MSQWGLLIDLLLIFIGVQLIYTVVLVSGYSKVNQLYIYRYPLFFRFFSSLSHYRVLSRVPCAIQKVISYLFYIQQCVYVNPNLPIYPPAPFPPLVSMFVLYIFVSISALQTSSSIPFFQVPHICVNIRYLFFSF